MTETEKVKNILAFLSILFGERRSIDGKDLIEEIMNFPPSYIIEKFERYVLSSRNEFDWGLHPSLRRQVFNKYCEKHQLPITDEL